jgi:hypothetical protein
VTSLVWWRPLAHRILIKKGKGRGVFATSSFQKGKLVQVDPVLTFPNSSVSGKIHRYTFEWDDDTSAIALGLGSLFNHSYNPSLIYSMERSESRIQFRARRAIVEGEELTINYNFDPEDRSPVGFKVT